MIKSAIHFHQSTQSLLQQAVAIFKPAIHRLLDMSRGTYLQATRQATRQAGGGHDAIPLTL